MSQAIQKTTITDRDGNPHDYTTIPFDYDKSVDLKLKLMGVLFRPLADAVGELLSGATESTKNDPANATFNFALVAEAVDWRQLGPVVEQFPERLVAAGGSELIAQILHSTVRRSGEGAALKLSNPSSRSKAFSGGNQVESYKAIKWVLGVNYAPFSMGASTGWSEAFDSLKTAFDSALAQISTQPTGENTTEPKTADSD
jgi:hypothetical protein